MADKTKPGFVKEIKRPKAGQVVASIGEELDITAGTITNPNDFFGKSDNDIVLQTREMDNLNPILYGLFQTRKLSLLALKREIIGEGIEADFVRDNFANIPSFHNKLSQILNAIKCGFSVTEIIWDEWEGSKWGIYNLLPRYQGKFIFSQSLNAKVFEDELKLLTKDNAENGISVNPFKFAVITYDEEYGNRYGNALYQKIYWPWFYIKNATKLYAIYVERFAAPLLKFSSESSIGTEDKAAIDNFIKNIKSATGIQLPNGIAFELVNAAQGGADSFEKFINQKKDEIAIAVVGQPSTVQSGGTGSYARDKVRENITRIDILGSDIRMCETFFNDRIIKPLVDLNFPNVTKYPKWRINKGVIGDSKIMAEVVTSLWKLKLPMTKKYAYETFGIPIPEKDDDLIESFQAPIGKQFSEVASVIDEISKLGI